MENHKHSTQEQRVIQSLRELPLADPPLDLKTQVMEQIEREQQAKVFSIQRFIARFFPALPSPGYAFGVVALVAAAFLLGRNSSAPLQEQVASVSEYAPVIAQEKIQPETAAASFLIGRGLLEDNRPYEALPMLRRAAMLDPENPEYAYWEGVGFWQAGDQEQEYNSYIRGLLAAPDSIPLLINLAHNYLSRKQYEPALQTYRAVLDLSPEEPAALYNVGLISRKLGKKADEIDAWKKYLSLVRTGDPAFRAVKRLNAYHDFTYRIYRMGIRKIIVSQKTLLSDASATRQQVLELTPLSAVLATNTNLALEIVVFIENDLEAARAKAQYLRKLLVASLGKREANRIRLSWFDKAEELYLTDSDEPVHLSEGLMLFTRQVSVSQSKEV